MSSSHKKLPKTGSPLPLVGALGFASLLLAAGLRAARRLGY
jgi:LPXTG-motif cell wall-anchored protein